MCRYNVPVCHTMLFYILCCPLLALLPSATFVGAWVQRMVSAVQVRNITRVLIPLACIYNMLFIANNDIKIVSPKPIVPSPRIVEPNPEKIPGTQPYSCE